MSWSVLFLDLRRSFGGKEGRCLDELTDLMESLSIGGGGVGDPDSSFLVSGNCGSS
jgi:hypothetical protein